ncbi:HNH endonuclease [Streptomyces vietnamensis]|uniref:HNH domain-containing protein n=1 Tax=Streptomyces vietnamensis TaxID=362257 RepID=A0A0B5I2G2_9ACTN|nr:HNH endonuclease [Streptomyces vietnamensis]AJF63798.1 hypothetical protein SVTN_04480 [Streptomyces vietnamensis]
MTEEPADAGHRDEPTRAGRRHVVEVSGGSPGRWELEVLDEERWGRLTEEERRAETSRAVRRRQGRRRTRRLRENGPRDRYTVEQVGERDGWECAICRYEVRRGFRAPHPCAPSVHHVVEVSAGGADSWGNVALTHLFCNSDAHTWGQKAPAVARRRLADRVLYGKHGPGRRERVPDAEAAALAEEILIAGTSASVAGQEAASGSTA